MITARKASVRVRVRVRVRARRARARADPRRGGEGDCRGVARPWDAPERSRRAQRAQRALLAVGRVPYPRCIAVPARPYRPATGAGRNASAGRGGAELGCPAAHPGGLGKGVVGFRGRIRSSPRGRRRLGLGLGLQVRVRCARARADPRRVGWALRGGAGLPSGSPGRPRRAQRA